MPTYVYRCTTCGHRFEKMQPISAAALTHCPVEECIQEDESLKGTGEVQRLVTGGAGLVFKGEGFYLTDYARKGKSKEGGSGGGSGSSGSGSSGSGSSGSGSSGSGGSGSGSSGSGSGSSGSGGSGSGSSE